MNLRCWPIAISGGIVFARTADLSGRDEAVTLRMAILGLVLGILVVYDLRERRIPNRVVLPAAALYVVSDLAGFDRWALVGSLAIVAMLFALALAVPRALGMGDVKLALLVAVALPATATIGLTTGLLIAAGFGCAVAAVRHQALNEIALPLAPFLALGTLVALA